MRFLLVSVDQPTVKKSLDIPDRLVQEKCKPKKSKVKRPRSKKNHPNHKVVDSINKPHQTSKSIIRQTRHNDGSIRRRD